jgi:hypothetical protein
MGLSLVEAIPAAIARATGAPRTSPIFVLVPVLCLVGCAWAGARTLERLGAARIPAAAGGVGLVLATPLWGYAGSDYGEPLQAFSIALSVLALVELREAPASRRWQVVLGAAAGWAILTKTLLVIVVAPLLAAAMVPPPGTPAPRRRAAPPPRLTLPFSLLFTFIGILFLWLFFEFARFGKMGGGYGGETFMYPFFTGLLRLTLLPNKGLLWYAPVSVLAVPGLLLLRRRDARLALALAASALALLFASSAWWAWDGQAGWGPRLVLPALPCLVVLACVALAGGRQVWRLAGALALVAGVAVNALGALVPFPAVYALSSQIAPQPISEGRAAGTPYEIDRAPDGTLRASAPHHLSLTPAWSPIRIHALALVARLRGGWDGSLPQLDPPFRPAPAASPAPALKLALAAPRPGFLRPVPAEWSDPYYDALRDQLVRAIDVKDFARAASLGEELTKREEKVSSNDPRTVALMAESLRLGSGATAALSYLSKKSPLLSSFSCHPWILFVRAAAEPPGDFACLPEDQREAFARAVAAGRQRGWTLTEWSRALTTGRP